MALSTILSRAQNGLLAELVRVEVHLAPGLPALNIVGLPEAAVRESKDRVKAAIQTCGYEFPNRRITCNLAPADLPKEGSRFDLAIALGILTASSQVPSAALDGVEVLGELSLSGEVRPVRGALPAALQAGEAGHALLLPQANVAEAALAARMPLHAARHLGELCAALHQGQGSLPVAEAPPPEFAELPVPDLRDVRGQAAARRALEIAAAGGHSLLMLGPPGGGKSMLASRLPGILPPMSDREAIEAAAVASIGEGGFDPRRWRQRPFRAPHHTASAAALVGGGSVPRPGEITLAHCGVLFLDEFPEFDRRVLEVLREPLETGQITVSRAARQSDFPARFQLVAAMNPCPCGYQGDSAGQCRCTPDQVARYRGRLSGPLLDRIDMQLFLPRVDQRDLMQAPTVAVEDSARVRQRVCVTRALQQSRAGKPNAELTPTEIERDCALDAPSQTMLAAAMQRLGLSARAYHRVLRLARTIADLGASPAIDAAALAEALRYRALDRATA